ncbi:MAG: hypothetical protein IJC17_02895 [Clostridia bacterium]|nr:hypothetical protein [Clostridia bacterium]
MYGNEAWEQFCRTGKVVDYLRYRGIDTNAAREESADHAVENGRVDHPREQPYR